MLEADADEDDAAADEDDDEAEDIRSVRLLLLRPTRPKMMRRRVALKGAKKPLFGKARTDRTALARAYLVARYCSVAVYRLAKSADHHPDFSMNSVYADSDRHASIYE